MTFFSEAYVNYYSLKLLSCGDYRNGIRKHTCSERGTLLMVPFICSESFLIIPPRPHTIFSLRHTHH